MILNYKAKDNFGEIRTGTVEAADEQAAVETLRKHNLIALSLSPAKSGLNVDISFFNRVKQGDLVVFSRQLSTLMEAKVPLVESLRTLTKQTKNPYFREIMFNIANDVNGGVSFSDSLSKYPKAFSKFFVSMVRSGETAGNLQSTLLYLADYTENNYDLMKKVKGAMMYPAFLVSALIIAMILMIVIVIPKMTGIFKESGQEIPLPTKILMGTSDFAVKYWWLALVIAAAVPALSFFLISRTEAGKEAWDMFIIKVPIFGKILQNVYMARFAENLSVLIIAGIPIVRALEIVGEIVGNVHYKKLILKALDAVKAGENMSAVLEESALVPALATSIISVGEKTGKLDQVLKNLGRSYKRDVDIVVANISKLIEPVLMVIMGILIAILVAAVLMPMYGMVNVIK